MSWPASLSTLEWSFLLWPWKICNQGCNWRWSLDREQEVYWWYARGFKVKENNQFIPKVKREEMQESIGQLMMQLIDRYKEKRAWILNISIKQIQNCYNFFSDKNSTWWWEHDDFHYMWKVSNKNQGPNSTVLCNYIYHCPFCSCNTSKFCINLFHFSRPH